MSERSSVGAEGAPTAGGCSRFAVLWLLAGAVHAFALTVFAPPVAFGVGDLRVAAALRRRLDGFGMFTVGFVLWRAVRAVLTNPIAWFEGRCAERGKKRSDRVLWYFY